MVCPSCGARLSDDARQCDLCGHSFVEDASLEVDPADGVASSTEPLVSAGPPTDAPVPAEAVAGTPAERYCGECGAPNPMGAKFCNACGSKLAPVRRAARPQAAASPPKQKPAKKQTKKPAGRPQSAVNRQVLILVGVSVVAVVAFFLISSRTPAPGAPATGSAPASNPAAGVAVQPLDQALQERIAPIEAAIAAATTTEERLASQEQLVEAFIQGGRLDRAAHVQEHIAEARNTVEDWEKAGNLHYDWMERQQGPAVGESARLAIAAYQKALELDPENLDVRTDMAIAYLNDPDNPMQAIEENQKVLEIDPLHPQANFNRGVMLTMIGRYQEAIDQYGRVLEIAEQGSYLYEEAGKRKADLEAAVTPAQP